MKRPVLSGIAFTAALCAGTAFAQTSATHPTSASTPGQSTQSITMSGCVANAASGAQGFTLSNPVVLPSGGSTSGAASSPATSGSSTASSSATQPPTSATPPTSTPPTSTPPTSATPPPSTAGTSGTSTARPTGTTGSAGTAGTAGTSSGTAGTSSSAMPPSTAGAAGRTSSTSAFNGYRLSGADLAQYAGKRVEVTGTFAPSSSSNSTASASGTGATNLQEFRVVSVKPIGGSCPQE